MWSVGNTFPLRNYGLVDITLCICYFQVITWLCYHDEFLYELCMSVKSSMCSSKWLDVVIIGYSDAFGVNSWCWSVNIPSWLYDYRKSYVDYSIEVCMITCKFTKLSLCAFWMIWYIWYWKVYVSSFGKQCTIIYTRRMWTWILVLVG